MNNIGCQSNPQFTNLVWDSVRVNTRVIQNVLSLVNEKTFSDETAAPEMFFYQSLRSRTFTGHKQFLCQTLASNYLPLQDIA